MAGTLPGEVGRAIDGALALFIGRPAPPGSFDVTAGGFWRSFGAIVLVLPSFAVMLAAELGMGAAAEVAEGQDEAAWFVASRLVGLAIDWAALPVVLAALAGPLGIGGRYVGFVVVRNWGSVVAAAVYALPALLYNLGLVGESTAILLSLVAFVAVVRFQYAIVRAALATPVPTSIGLVVLDLALSLVIGEMVARLAGG